MKWYFYKYYFNKSVKNRVSYLAERKQLEDNNNKINKT